MTIHKEIDLKEIKKELKRKYDLSVEIKGNKLCFNEFNGYIKSDESFEEVESLCRDICDEMQDKYDCTCDYSILDSGYEFIIEIF